MNAIQINCMTTKYVTLAFLKRNVSMALASIIKTADNLARSKKIVQEAIQLTHTMKILKYQNNRQIATRTAPSITIQERIDIVHSNSKI